MTTAKPIPGWYLTGPNRDEYEMSLPEGESLQGHRAALLRCIKSEPSGYGCMGNSFRPGDFRGKRVRYSAAVRTEDVDGWVGLCFRVDPPEPRSRGTVIDNMSNRPIKETTDWERYECVLDVAEDSASMNVFLMLIGGGSAWISNITLEIVGREVPTTETQPGVPAKPRNLNFSETGQVDDA